MDVSIITTWTYQLHKAGFVRVWSDGNKCYHTSHVKQLLLMKLITLTCFNNLSTNITSKFRANDFFFWYMAGTDITKRGGAVHIVVIYTGGNRGTNIVQSPVE